MALMMVILLRKDLKLPPGKAAVQAAHAAVELACKLPRETRDAWLRQGQKKVVLRVENEEDLSAYVRKAQHEGLHVVFIHDAGRTVVPAGTLTAAAIGLAEEDVFERITGDLKLY